ncbi:hypothetical protein RAK27_11900 [Carnobacterium maltaromaticum]|uniref:DUF1642 domain-containing protein n=1 Tax=Carnobacterium maltaromaticum TaxID=2751 RepID=A0AAW9JS75_CARML|nr:hypothetical protein [Carnobacterium maltaromaticum]MDZ5759367.1 hypothetical protein [Carnobacterium maltaromaticum]
MRETKFRGKVIGKQEELEAMGVIDKNGWATGNLIQNEQHTMIVGNLLEFDDEDMMCDWWVPVIPETVEQIKAEINEDQQIALEWLKAYSDSDNGDKPISGIWYMLHLISENLLESRVRNSYFNLTEKQQFEVLQAFAEWGLSDEKV